MARSRHSDESGFSVVEVLIAAVVMMVGVVALAQLFAVSTDANRRARNTTSAMVLAQQKMEQLRGLTWGYDLLGLPLSDTTTDTSVLPFSSSGSGLSPSPANTLTQNTAGFVDYLDWDGQWIGNGITPPVGATFIRRWSIEPLPTNPNNTLILQVLVTRWRARDWANAGNVRRLPEEARLVSVKTRKTS